MIELSGSSGRLSVTSTGSVSDWLLCSPVRLCVPVQDAKLVTWAHETLIKLLDSDLLPVYLDVLQILKSKVYTRMEEYVSLTALFIWGSE